MLRTVHLLPQYHIYDCVNHSYRRSQFRDSHAQGATNTKREALSYSIQSTMEGRNLCCAFGSVLVHTKHATVTLFFTLQEYLSSVSPLGLSTALRGGTPYMSLRLARYS